MDIVSRTDTSNRGMRMDIVSMNGREEDGHRVHEQGMAVAVKIYSVSRDVQPVSCPKRG